MRKRLPHQLGRGFTLIELVATVLVIGILASMAVPQFNRAIRRGRLRAARDVLLTIYAGQENYRLANNGRYKEFGDPPTLDDWRAILMDDPNVNAPGGMRFLVNVDNTGVPPAFLAFVIEGTSVPLTIDNTQHVECVAGSDCPQ